MNNMVKTTIVAGTVAVLSSLATLALVGATNAGSSEMPLFTESGSHIQKVMQSPEESAVDFVSAAESTVNGKHQAVCDATSKFVFIRISV